MKHPSPESLLHRRESARLDALENGRSTTHPTEPVNDTAYAKSSDSADYDEFDEQRDESLDRRQDPFHFSFHLQSSLQNFGGNLVRTN